MLSSELELTLWVEMPDLPIRWLRFQAEPAGGSTSKSGAPGRAWAHSAAGTNITKELISLQLTELTVFDQSSGHRGRSCARRSRRSRKVAPFVFLGCADQGKAPL